jgi:hypothetical protein
VLTWHNAATVQSLWTNYALSAKTTIMELRTDKSFHALSAEDTEKKTINKYLQLRVLTSIKELSFYTSCFIYRVSKKSHAQTSSGEGARGVGEGVKTKIYCKELYVGDASLVRYGSSNWVLLRLEIKKTTEVFCKKKNVFCTKF